MKPFSKKYLLLAAGFFYSLQLFAQEEERRLAEQYKDEHAVVVRKSERLELSSRKGELQAHSSISKEILLIDDQASGLYNTDYVYHNSFRKLHDIEGLVFVPDGDRYRKMKVDAFKTVKSSSANIFYDDDHQTMITYSGLGKGAKTQLSYDVEFTNLHFLTPFYFQEHIPVSQCVYEVSVPKGMKIGWQLKGKNTDLIKQTVEEKRHETIYRWTAENLPAYKLFDDAPSASYYIPHLIVYLASYENGKAEVPFMGTLKDLYGFYYPFIANVNKIDQAPLKKLVAELTAGAGNDEQKAEKIYQWVQGNIRYVAFEDGMGGFIPRDATSVLEKKYGDCKDMANLLVTMCREAGLHAYHSWIGTRDIPYHYEETPLPIADNHMICTIETGGKYVFLDATHATMPYGLAPYSLQGKEALLGISKDQYKIVPIPITKPDMNRFSDTTNIRISGKNVEGNLRLNIGGYTAWYIEDMMQYQNEKNRDVAVKGLLARGSNKYLQKQFDFRILPGAGKALMITADFEIPDYAQQSGKELYINLNLQRSYEDNYLNVKERKVAVETSYKKLTTQVVNLEIPKGYHLSYLPPTSEKSCEGLWKYKISYAHQGNKVQLVKEFEFNNLMLEPEKFDAHNELIKELRKQYKESVVLVAD